MTDALKESSDTVDITLKDGDKLSSNMVQSIKGSGKKVNLNYYDNNKKLLYTWMVDGSKIENTNSFLTKVSASDGENSVVKKLVNNVDGTLITLDNKDLLPKGTMLKYYVGDKYKNGDVVNVYYHNLYDEKLDEVGSKLVVKDGYVTFNTSKGSDYFVTLDNLGNESEVTTTGTKKSINIFLIISIIEFIVIIGLLVYFLKFRDKNK